MHIYFTNQQKVVKEATLFFFMEISGFGRGQDPPKDCCYFFLIPHPP